MDYSGHKLWGLYDDLRTVRLFEKYYTVLQSRTVTKDKFLDGFLAVAASGAFGAFFLEETLGAVYWTTIGSIAAFVATIRPFFGLTGRIVMLSGLMSDYSRLVSEINHLKLEVQEKQTIPDDLIQRLNKIRETKWYPLGEKEGRAGPQKTRLLKRLQKLVEREFPLESFTFPK